MRFMIALLTMAVASTVVSAEDYKVGDLVAVTRRQPLRADPNDAAVEVDDVFLGLVVYVQKVEGKWILISNGKPGWLNRENVVPLSHAAEYFTKELTREPKDSNLLFARAVVHHKNHDFTSAIADYTALIAKEPEQPAYRNARGALWREKGEYKEAIADYDEAIRLDPTSAFAFNNRGIAFLANGEPDRAVADFAASLRLDPKNAKPYSNRGDAWYRKGSFDKAIDDYDEAIRIDGKYPTAYANRGWLAATCPDERYRNGKNAKDDATRACELTQWQWWGGLRTMAAAHAELGAFEKAVEFSEESLKLCPDLERKAESERLDLYRAGKPYREKIAVVHDDSTRRGKRP